MSASKFASITSSLLARKGEAKPWAEPERISPAWRSVEPARDFPPNISSLVQPTSLESAAETPRALQKTCSVKMSFQEYERLGIMAVKMGQTRGRLLQDALRQVLAGMAQEYRAGCPCLEQGQNAGGECCQA